MLRISIQERTETAVTVLVEGRIAGLSASELWRTCEEILAEGRVLVLDLSAVSFIERNALQNFRALAHRGARFAKCSPFVAEQLNSVISRRPETPGE